MMYQLILNHIYVKCPTKDYHTNIKVKAKNFYLGYCPYCSGNSLHEIDSFAGQYGTKLFDIWDYKKNKKNPYKIHPKSKKKYWFKCNNSHSYEQEIYQAVLRDFKCPKCSVCQNEIHLKNKICNFIKSIGYTASKNWQNSLSNNNNIYPDIAIPELNLLIEIKGFQHYIFDKNFHKTENKFNIYIKHDLMKKNYILQQGYHYLEIPIWLEANDRYKDLIKSIISSISNNNNIPLIKNI